MNKKSILNSPRSLKACQIKGVIPNELYFTNYKEYLSSHPEISNLPDDVKKYRFNLLERLRLKTIKMVKDKRDELIKNESRNSSDNKDFELTRKKWRQNFSTLELDNIACNMTFSAKMSNLISKERDNIQKIKSKQKQNIQFMIEQQMKAEFFNFKTLQKDKKVKENREKKRKEISDRGIRNQIIMEERKQKRLSNVEEMMKKKRMKIFLKHDKLDRKRNEMINEKNKKREELIQKRTEELIKAYNHRSQLDILRQEQEKKINEQKLNNEEKDRKVLERINNLKKIRKEINHKNREKSAEIIQRNQEKKEFYLTRIIKKINKKHDHNYQRLQKYYKDIETKNKKFKIINIKKKSNQESLMKSMVELRKKKLEDYYNDNMKKEQNIIISKLLKKQKVLNQKIHEEEFLELVNDNKQQIELKNKKKKNALENKMEELDHRITNYKKEEGHKSLIKLQESFVKQVEKNFTNKRIQRIKQYNFELKEKEMKEKDKKIDLMKNEKIKFQNERKKMNVELQNEKYLLMNKFNHLVKGKSKINVEVIKQLYPEDEQLYKKMKNMEDIYKIGDIREEVVKKEKQRENTTKSEFNKTKSIFKKKNEEIEKRVIEFRQKLREKLKKDIETERINESRRIKDYEEAITFQDKQTIEQKNKLERSEFGKRITDLNENIEHYVEEYRKKLINEFSYC